MHRATSSFPVPVSPRMITGKVWSLALPMRLCIVPIREETPMRPPGLTVDSNWFLNAWSSRLSGSGPGHCSGAWASSAHKKLSDNQPSSAICTAFAAFGELSGYVARRAPEPGLLGRGILTVSPSAFTRPVSAESWSHTFIESEAEGFWGFKLKHRRVEPFDEVHRCCWHHVSLL